MLTVMHRTKKQLFFKLILYSLRDKQIQKYSVGISLKVAEIKEKMKEIKSNVIGMIFFFNTGFILF